MSLVFLRSAAALEEMKNFRSRTMPSNDLTHKTITLSASRQFSLPALAELIHERSAEWGALRVVDLREEPHFMMNNDSITYYNGANNDAFRNLSLEQINEESMNLIEQVKKAGSILVKSGRAKKKNRETKEVVIEFAKEEMIKIEDLITEEDAVLELKAHYTLLPFTDHDSQDVAKKVDEIINTIFSAIDNGDQWIHFHCHEGKGRAAFAMLIGMFIMQAKSHSLEELQGAFEIKELKNEKKKYGKFSDFFNSFYQYCKECEPRKNSWQEWAKNHADLDTLLNEMPKNKKDKLQKKEKDKAKVEKKNDMKPIAARKEKKSAPECFKSFN